MALKELRVLSSCWTVRPVEEQDFPHIAATESAIGPEPTTEAQIREWEEFCRTDADYPMQWFVAVDENGAFAGWCNCGKAQWLGPDRREIYVGVPPERRRNGVGTLLLEHAENWAWRDNPRSLAAWCRGYDDASFAWAAKRGYALERQRTESVLNLVDLDPSKFDDRLRRVEGQGIEVQVLSEEQVKPFLPDLYRIYIETFREVPFRSPGAPDVPFESWVHETMGPKVAKIFALAIAGNRVVGSTNLYMPAAEGQGAGINYTGVLKEYRGKGIAFALKARAAEAGAKAGAKWIRTQNDADNPAILSINRRMGFRLVPGPRLLRKTL